MSFFSGYQIIYIFLENKLTGVKWKITNIISLLLFYLAVLVPGMEVEKLEPDMRHPELDWQCLEEGLADSVILAVDNCCFAEKLEGGRTVELPAKKREVLSAKLNNYNIK